MKEKAAFHVNGYLGLLGAIIIGLISLWLMFVGFTRNFPVLLTIGIILFLIVILFSTSLTPKPLPSPHRRYLRNRP